MCVCVCVCVCVCACVCVCVCVSLDDSNYRQGNVFQLQPMQSNLKPDIFINI